MPLSYSGERFILGHGGAGIHLEHVHRYRLAAGAVVGDVLDLGCGVGYGARMFARRATRVVGVDSSAPAIAVARREAAAPNLSYVVGDVRFLPLHPRSFDWVVCFELLEHVREGEAVLGEIARVLRPGGQLLLSTPNRPAYSEARNYRNPFHLREFDREELRTLLAQWFPHVVLLGQRLVAGSVVWDLGRSPERQALTLLPDGAPQGVAAREPVYHLAWCRRRGRGRDLALESTFTGSLEEFLKEQAVERRESEARLRGEYESMITSLRSRLEVFDQRVRQLGLDVEEHARARQRDRAAAEGSARRLRQEHDDAERLLQQRHEQQDLGLRRQHEEEIRRSRRRHEQEQQDAERRWQAEVAAYQLNAERLTSQLREFEARVLQLGAALEAQATEHQGVRLEHDRVTEDLRGQISALTLAHDRLTEQLRGQISALTLDHGQLQEAFERQRRDLYWSYEHWQQRETELARIKGSRMWRAWTAYHALRRAASAAQRRVLAVVRRGPGLALGWIYLAGWTALTWLRSRLRRRRSPVPSAAGSPAPGSMARRPRVLIVCPYPIVPIDHGGGVRLYNLIRRLREHCDLQLLVFIRAADDPRQREALEPLVEKLYFHHWQPRFRPDFFALKPSGVQLFESAEASALIADIVARERIDILQIEYAELGQYGLENASRVKVVQSEIDICFRSRARRRRAGMHRRYRMDRIWGFSAADWMRQFRYEVGLVRRSDQVQFMSSDDADYLAPFAPDAARRFRVVPNAVDVAEFLPPEAPRGRHFLFLGNFQHLPNLDALDYLLERLWPPLRRRCPDAELWVVGAEAGEAVRRWHGRDGVTVVGAVEATRPYYQGCRAVLAPIRAASGTRLKVLEALACATPVVTTSIGAEGIAGVAGEHYLVGDDPEAFVDAACRLLEDGPLCDRLGAAGRALVERRYSWEHSAASALEGYRALLASDGAHAERSREAPFPRLAAEPGAEVDISIVIPTLAGGEVLDRCLTAIAAQETDYRFEVVCIDSASPAVDLETMRRHGVRLIGIDPAQFNHGRTRDQGAAASRGRVLVFLNQDAVPRDRDWLSKLTAPLFSGEGCVATQGGILEMPDPRQRFYWDSCGERFYFTRESRRWLQRYFGIGFSTVNAAIRRDVWERHPFGEAAIMEDKKWQREVVEAGHHIAVVPDAAVHHTHDYDLRTLVRRCRSEGFGWRLVGETYSLRDGVADLLSPRVYADLARGLARGQVRSLAELLFPLLRPLLVYGGNRWGRGISS